MSSLLKGKPLYEIMVYWCQILVPHYPAAKLLNFVRNKAMTKLPGYNGNYKRESFSHFFIVAIIIIFINTTHNLSVKRVHEAVDVTMASGFYKSFFLFSLEQESDFSLCLINKFPKNQKLQLLDHNWKFFCCNVYL